MSENKTTNNEATPEEVTNFIAGKSKNFFGVSIKESELSEEAQDKIKKATQDEQEENPRPKSDLPMPKEFDETKPTVGENLFKNQRLDDLLGRIDITDIDKDLYMKALLNDEPFETSVSPIRGMEVVVKSRTMEEDEFVFNALYKEKESGKILGPETYFTRLQLFLACVQVRRIGHKVVTFDHDPNDSQDVIYGKLVEHVNNVYLKMQAPKWNAIVAAVRMFEAKLKICNDSLRDENFWQAAGIV